MKGKKREREEKGKGLRKREEMGTSDTFPHVKQRTGRIMTVKNNVLLLHKNTTELANGRKFLSWCLGFVGLWHKKFASQWFLIL
jgi:hypothetical protein